MPRPALMLALDLVNTIAIAGVVLFAGYGHAMANMSALVERYGPAPRAFLTVPLVGAFFIDFINAVIITICLNLWA